MTTKNQLLFSKKQKVDKSTSMGDSENAKGMFGVPQNNKQELNSQKKDIPEEGKQTEKQQQDKSKDNEKKIERASNEYLKNTTTKESVEEIEKKNTDYEKEIKELENKIIKERNDFIKDIKDKKKEFNDKKVEIKNLSNEFNQKIAKLKDYEQKLVIKTKFNVKTKTKTEEDIKNEIRILDAQIKNYKEREMTEKDYLKLKEKTDSELNKEKDLQTKLDKLNSKISKLNEKLNGLRKIAKEHTSCEEENQKKLEELRNVNKAYQYEMKIAKNLTLLEIAKTKTDNDFDEDEVKDKEGNEPDNKEKAQEEQNNILPKIHTLKFPTKGLPVIEAKINKKNKLGTKNDNSKGNAINLYQKLSNEFIDNERYKKEANKYIRINQSNANVKTEANLFKDYENDMLQKIIPPKMINSYKDKYNDILKQKKEIEKKHLNESHNIKNGNIVTNNNKDFNDLKIKELNQKQAILNLKYQKLKARSANMMKNIKDVEKQIKKEEDKLKMREKDRARILIYFNKMKEGIKNNNNENEKEKEINN